MNRFTKFCLPTMFQKLRYGSLTQYIEICTPSHKSTDNIHKLCLCLEKEHTYKYPI